MLQYSFQNWLDTVLKYKWTSLCTDTIVITNIIIFKPQEETEHKNSFLLSSKYSAHVTPELRQHEPETHTKPNAWSVSEEKEKDWLLTLPHLVRSSMSTSMESCSMCRSSRSISKWTSSSFRPETSIITIISLSFHNNTNCLSFCGPSSHTLVVSWSSAFLFTSLPEAVLIKALNVREST